jgi:hypothetical protein
MSKVKVDDYGFPIFTLPVPPPRKPKDKYEAINDNYFGFELFEEIFKAINERINSTTDPLFNNGVASAEAAVRRVREHYYESFKVLYENKD